MRSQPNRAKITPELVQTVMPGDKVFDINDTEVKGFMLRVRPNGDKSYFFRYRNKDGLNRTLKIASVGQDQFTPRKARDAAIKLSGAVKDGHDPQAEKRDSKQQSNAERSEPTLREYLDNQYKDHVVTHHRTGDTNYRRIVACSGDLLKKKLKLITPKDVDLWKASRLMNGAKKSTVDRDTGSLRAAFTKAVEWGLIPDSPFKNVKAFNEDNKRIRYLSDAEEGLLRAVLDDREEKMRTERDSANKFRLARGYEPFPEYGAYVDHLKPMVILSMNSGLRQGELFKLRWESVDLERGMMTVTAKTTKADKTRHVPLSAEAQRILEAWGKQTSKSGLVFPGRDDKPFVDVKTAWNRLLLDAGIKDFHWHDLRHHFASRLVMRGVDLNTVRELMGHGDIKMTLRYAHLAPEHKKAAIAMAFG